MPGVTQPQVGAMWSAGERGSHLVVSQKKERKKSVAVMWLEGHQIATNGSGWNNNALGSDNLYLDFGSPDY